VLDAGVYVGVCGNVWESVGVCGSLWVSLCESLGNNRACSKRVLLKKGYGDLKILRC
jgi:hypothetical protein